MTVTSAYDLGEACHLGLCLLHAVIDQRVALPQQAHACTKFRHCFPSFSTIKDSEHLHVFYAPPGVVLKWAIKSDTSLRLQAVRFLLTSCYQQK